MNRKVIVIEHSNGRGKPIESRKAIVDPYRKIIDKLKKAQQEGIRLIVQERGNPATYVLTVSYVGDRWFKGDIKCHGISETTTIPHTVLYSDIYVDNVRITGVGTDL